MGKTRTMSKHSSNMFDMQREALLQHNAPLATRMRATSLEHFVGQEHIVGDGHLLKRAIQQDNLFSIILWGPPGCGKTTLASVIANVTSAHYEQLSAVSASVTDLRHVIKEAQDRLGMIEKRTILFLDEIHRFNKNQQDAALPYVEDGTIILIGATTENPSFEVNRALLSRCRVFALNSLEDEHIGLLVDRALADTQVGLGNLNVVLATDARHFLLNRANGDARVALNALESAVLAKAPSLGDKRLITIDDIRDALQSRATRYDKHGELHYNAISALHKSVRDSDPDGALYWLARMLEGGEDPLYIARRVVRIAIEDVGLADPHALPLTMAAQQAVHFLGQPEGDLALAEAVVYLCQAPKSNAIYRGYGAALKDVQQTRNEPVPLHLRNAVTPLMQELGYGKGYAYAHDLPAGRSDQAHLPPALEGTIYYDPVGRGFEAQVRERLAWREQRGVVEQPAATPSPSTALGTQGKRDEALPTDPQALAGEESQEYAEHASPPLPSGKSKNREKDDRNAE
jgi:putative ATPase